MSFDIDKLEKGSEVMSRTAGVLRFLEYSRHDLEYTQKESWDGKYYSYKVSYKNRLINAQSFDYVIFIDSRVYKVLNGENDEELFEYDCDYDLRAKINELYPPALVQPEWQFLPLATQQKAILAQARQKEEAVTANHLLTEGFFYSLMSENSEWLIKGSQKHCKPYNPNLYYDKQVSEYFAAWANANGEILQIDPIEHGK